MGGDHAGLVHTFFYLFYNPKYLRILFQSTHDSISNLQICILANALSLCEKYKFVGFYPTHFNPKEQPCKVK